MANEGLRAVTTSVGRDLEAVTVERQRVEAELGTWWPLWQGGRTPPRGSGRRSGELDNEAERVRQAVTPAPLQIQRAWVEQQLQGFTSLLANDPAGARRELDKHLDDLRLTPAPEVGARVIRITGRAKIDGLLEGQEAVRLQLVAGAGFAECYTALTTYWIDLVRPLTHHPHPGVAIRLPPAGGLVTSLAEAALDEVAVGRVWLGVPRE